MKRHRLSLERDRSVPGAVMVEASSARFCQMCHGAFKSTPSTRKNSYFWEHSSHSARGLRLPMGSEFKKSLPDQGLGLKPWRKLDLRQTPPLSSTRTQCASWSLGQSSISKEQKLQNNSKLKREHYQGQKLPMSGNLALLAQATAISIGWMVAAEPTVALKATTQHPRRSMGTTSASWHANWGSFSTTPTRSSFWNPPCRPDATPRSGTSQQCKGFKKQQGLWSCRPTYVNGELHLMINRLFVTRKGNGIWWPPGSTSMHFYLLGDAAVPTSIWRYVVPRANLVFLVLAKLRSIQSNSVVDGLWQCRPHIMVGQGNRSFRL